MPEFAFTSGREDADTLQLSTRFREFTTRLGRYLSNLKWPTECLPSSTPPTSKWNDADSILQTRRHDGYQLLLQRRGRIHRERQYYV
jgi:hypothetical protein